MQQPSSSQDGGPYPARDRADAELLEAGEHGRLLATYFEEVRDRCALPGMTHHDRSYQF